MFHIWAAHVVLGLSSEGWASDMVTKERLINCGFCLSVSIFSLECKLVSLCSVMNTVLNYSNFLKKLFDFLPGIPEPFSKSLRDPIPSLKTSANFGLCSCPNFLFINFHSRNKFLLSDVYSVSIFKVRHFLPLIALALLFSSFDFFSLTWKKKQIFQRRSDGKAIWSSIYLTIPEMILLLFHTVLHSFWLSWCA